MNAQFQKAVEDGWGYIEKNASGPWSRPTYAESLKRAAPALRDQGAQRERKRLASRADSLPPAIAEWVAMFPAQAREEIEMLLLASFNIQAEDVARLEQERIREALEKLPRYGDGVHHQDAWLIDLNGARALLQEEIPEVCQGCGQEKTGCVPVGQDLFCPDCRAKQPEP